MVGLEIKMVDILFLLVSKEGPSIPGLCEPSSLSTRSQGVQKINDSHVPSPFDTMWDRPLPPWNSWQFLFVTPRRPKYLSTRLRLSVSLLNSTRTPHSSTQPVCPSPSYQSPGVSTIKILTVSISVLWSSPKRKKGTGKISTKNSRSTHQSTSKDRLRKRYPLGRLSLWRRVSPTTKTRKLKGRREKSKRFH